VVSRDLDYGVTLDGVSYANDHLRQEFSERVSKKKKLLLYARLTDALKLFEITISQQEEEAEQEIVDDVAQRSHEEFTTFKLDSSFNSTDARNLRLQKLFAAIRRVEPADATPSPAE
jgi:hypothetical protein